MLIPNSRKIWHRLWSVRLALLSSVAGSSAAVFAFLGEQRGSFPLVILSSILSIGAAVARLVAQPKLHGSEE